MTLDLVVGLIVLGVLPLTAALIVIIGMWKDYRRIGKEERRWRQ